MNVLIEAHRSPDGLLHLVVHREPNGDRTIGFAGCPWQTRGSVLARKSGLAEDQAIAAFVESILNDRMPVVVSITNGSVTDIRPQDDTVRAGSGCENTSVVVRHWSGTAAHAA